MFLTSWVLRAKVKCQWWEHCIASIATQLPTLRVTTQRVSRPTVVQILYALTSMLRIRLAQMSPSIIMRLAACTGRRYVHATLPLSTTSTASKSAGSVQHTADSYAKDVDDTPAPDHQVYRMDPSNENVQKPYEAPSGEWSRAGVKTSEYVKDKSDGGLKQNK